GIVAPALLPLSGRLGHVLAQLPALCILREPALQAWPLAEQRFVRELDRALIAGKQPVRRQAGEHRGGDRIGVDVELVERNGATGERLRRPAGYEPTQDPPRGRALLLVELFV